MIQFGEWLPDQPDMNNQLVQALNVVPIANGYKSLNAFSALSGSASDTILGIYSAKADDGTANLFAGDSTRLYEFNPSTSALDDISGGTYSLGTNERWRFVQFGNQVITSGGIGEYLQEYTLGSSTQFATLSTDAPKADYIAVVRDFVFTGNIDEGSGRKPYRVRWSGFNDPTSWTSGTNQSDFQDCVDSGAITGIVGGEYATILMERGIFRATYSGLPLVFQFDKVESQRGCKISGTVCNVGQSTTAIGENKVDDFFKEDCDFSYKNLITSSTDPINQIAMWSYVSNENTTGTPDRLLIFNYNLGRWSLANLEANLLVPFFTAGYTLEQLDNVSTSIETLPASLDSNVWRGGDYFFGGALGDKIYTMTGSPLEATIETGEIPLAAGKHNFLSRVYPYYEKGTASIQVGTRDNMSDDPTFTNLVSPNTDNYANFRAQGRYHRVRMKMTGEWKSVQGIDIEAREIGRR
jgi:hypothetical protein